MKSVARAAALLASTVSLAAAVACGGHTATDDLSNLGDGGASSSSGSSGTSGGSSGTSGGSSGTSGGSSGTSGGSSGTSGGHACPASTPAEGASCSPEQLSCEYGSDPDFECNVVAECVGGRWQLRIPPPNAQVCPSPGLRKDCPPSFAQAGQGGSCAPPGFECDYPQGRCDCTLGFGGPVQLDAGSGHWFCEAPPKGCPQPRPRLGSACSTSPSLVCDYGACFLPGGLAMQCQSGIWTQTLTACPGLPK
jgi:hypothetical protein